MGSASEPRGGSTRGRSVDRRGWSFRALSLMVTLGLSACASPPPPTFDLTAPSSGLSARGGRQLAVTEPVALETLNSQQIVVHDKAGAVSSLTGAQWSDRLPALVQTRLIETFANAGQLRRVGRPGDGTIAAFQLATELRQFYITAGTGEAVVQIAARVIDAATGQVISARIFTAKVPTTGTLSGPAGAAALNEALGVVLRDIVRWA
ncbi:MAG: membrane integrity-associated transporter subunit PqiC [Chelatococcus sp.]|nr:ABC-type transport auxiliary lipoprotein family protein [Chelatococcus sp.]MBS7738012.1 membrane integrity-associated transporter subunit PqiC [Chelatococcus sp. HY11]MBX3536108.1 membrane integrity-associated transporter subunit PqiC [Chelatococcus sp.]MBX3546349.1 membrane integrity-associated transporter subunit PqiC [Chelatococcus sp.]MCO5077643.1 ABC-type transport auxiliary lipoprotein family protein [Chelatococcus sp.]